MRKNLRSVGNPTDVPEGFQLDDDGYDPNKEYTRSRDSVAQGGHGVDRQIKFPESMVASAMEIISEKNLPTVKTFEAAVRSAVYHWIHSRNKMTIDSDQIEFLLQREAWKCELDAKQAFIRGNNEIFEQYKAACHEAATNSEWHIAVELVIQGREMAEKMPSPNDAKILVECKILEDKLPAASLPHLRALEGLGDVDPSIYSHVRIWK